jgi:peroxiredoxin
MMKKKPGNKSISARQTSTTPPKAAKTKASSDASAGKDGKKRRQPGRPWHKNPVSVFVIALLTIAVIAGIAGYISSHQPDDVPQSTQNTTQQVQLPLTPYTIAPPSTQSSSSAANNITVTDAAVTDPTANTLTVKWKTNVPCLGEAHATYTNRELTISSFPEDVPTTDHTALIAALAPSTGYKIDIISRNSSGAKEVFAVPGIFQTTPPHTEMEFKIGDSAPGFTLTDTSGKAVTLSEYSGKWVILVFWDMTCNACKEELPYVDGYYKQLSDPDTVMLTISNKGQPALVQSFLKSQKYSFTALLDTDGMVSDRYTIAAYPVCLLLDGSGKIVKIRQTSFKSEKELSDFIKEGIAGK